MIQFEVVETANDQVEHAAAIRDRLNAGWQIVSQHVVSMQWLNEDTGAVDATVYYTTFLQRGIRADACQAAPAPGMCVSGLIDAVDQFMLDESGANHDSV